MPCEITDNADVWCEFHIMQIVFTPVWKSLNVSTTELRLPFTLVTGQSFRWRSTSPNIYTGVIDKSVFQLKETENDIFFRCLNKETTSTLLSDEKQLREYFSLKELSLEDKIPKWCAQDNHFQRVAPFLKGARVLRQDPLECLFQFICSSNNNILRIQSMVETLCKKYGDLLWPIPKLEANALHTTADANKEEQLELPIGAFYAFPRLNQMTKIQEEDLRQIGFGYRAKYISNCVQELLEKEPDGETWLMRLREMSYKEAHEQLCSLSGVGPKVASCVALFSLDKHQAIPVDTHVHQLALREYLPQLKGKTLTKKVMSSVEEAFQERFGGHAGWAHNILFVAELGSHQHHLPVDLQRPKQHKTLSTRKRKRQFKSNQNVTSS